MNFLSGGGELGQLMRQMDWSMTPLGPAGNWPRALKTAVRIVLTSRQPMFVWWGDQLINLYNDAYCEILGGKHPWALGRPASVVWAEIWPQISLRAESAFRDNEGTYDESLMLIMERNGYPEETYYTFSYSPVPDDDGRTAGIFCANTDDTGKIIGERQVALLRDLAAGTADARTVNDACRLSASSLGSNSRDLPFALIYLESQDHSGFHLCGNSGMATDHPLTAQALRWPLAEVLQNGVPHIVEDLPASDQPLPTGGWDRPPSRIAILPIAPSGQTGRAGVLVAGLNPYRLFDDSYRGFLSLVAGQIGAAIANAQAYEAERERAESLAELDRAKTLFFSNVSHEFRTPLMLMLGPAEEAVLDASEPLGPRQRERIELLRRNGKRLLKLVNALLDFSRLEAGRVEAFFEPVDLSQFTTEIASFFRSAVEHAGLQLVVDCPPLREPVFVDRDMWEKIVLNLISNALKFTFQGSITVAIGTEDGWVRLRVIDTGVGISSEQLGYIFERFRRVEGARGRTHEGTGIGLALVQELTRLHGGTVGVESVEGQGSTFTIAIPFGKAHLPAEQIGAGRHQSTPQLRSEAFVEESLRWLALPDVVAEDTLLPVHERPSEGRLRERILLADDNADMRQYVTRLLEESYEVEPVSNGRLALEAIRRRRPDLVLSDVMMPELDGFGLVEEIRRHPELKNLPVVLISARAGEEATVEGISSGADEYLVKPFTARELKARVSTSLKLARTRKEALVRERALRAEAEGARTRLNEVLETIEEGFFSLDHDWRWTYVNRRAAEMAGREAEQMLGRAIWEEIPSLKDTIVDSEFHRTARERKPLRFEYLAASERWYEFRAYPTAEGLTVFCDEITEKKRMEESLQQIAKLESLGVLAGGVAHDFNNILVGILGNASLAYDMLPPSHSIRPIIAATIQASERAADLTRQMLAYSGRGRFVIDPVNLSELVRENLVLLKSSISRTVELVLELSDGLPAIEGDRAQMQQVVMNLLINAAEAIGNQPGRVVLRTGREMLEEKDVAVRGLANTIEPGEYVSLEVEDNGCGMTREVVSKIFDPFFTTKFTGRGLGLAAVLGIVSGHRGDIRVESTPGAGTRFRLLFPASTRLPQTAERAEIATAVPRGEGTILVIDDEEPVRSMVRTAVEHYGYTAIVVENGQQALELANASADVRLILLDVTMPVMTGEQTLPMLRKTYPGVPVVLSSGYSEIEISHRFEGQGLAGFLQKPYGSTKLMEIIAHALAVVE